MTGAAGTPDLADVPAADWHEARRRFEVIRVLAELPERSRSDAEAAAKALGYSVTSYIDCWRATSVIPVSPACCRVGAAGGTASSCCRPRSMR